ncbi:hypothetical protein D3C78_1295530 [compost metagenome]
MNGFNADLQQTFLRRAANGVAAAQLFAVDQRLQRQVLAGRIAIVTFQFFGYPQSNGYGVRRFALDGGDVQAMEDRHGYS